MKYLHPGVTDELDIDWLCFFTKFDERTIAAFKAHFVHGWPANLAAAKHGIEKGNFSKKLAKLELIEHHYQSRLVKEQLGDKK